MRGSCSRRLEKSRFNNRSRSHHADYFARKNSFGRFITDLFANRDVVTFLNEAREIIFNSVVRNACEGSAQSLADGA